MIRLSVILRIVFPLAAGALACVQVGATPAAALSVQAYTYALTGRVVHVADGDTFTILVDGSRQRVRMASIDAPEITKGRAQPGQPFSQASRNALAGLISGKVLVLECFERDPFERHICDVPLAGTSSANRQQVAAGMAWANMEGDGRFMRDPGLPVLERQARESRSGLWQGRHPQRPWVWRYQCWKQHRC